MACGLDVVVDRHAHQLGHPVHEAVRRQNNEDRIVREQAIQRREPGTVQIKLEFGKLVHSDVADFSLLITEVVG